MTTLTENNDIDKQIQEPLLSTTQHIIKSFKEEEKELIDKVIEKTNKINFLKIELDAAIKMKEFYQKRIKDIGDTIVKICE